MNLLKKVNRVTYCEWKGNCSYWDIILPDGSTIHSKAFGYERSNPPYEAIIDCVAFYADWADCYIDDEKVTPQPGGKIRNNNIKKKKKKKQKAKERKKACVLIF